MAITGGVPRYLEKLNIINAAPYFQYKTTKQKGCQIDLLIQGRSTLYVCEFKYKKEINTEVISEVKEKILRIKNIKTYTVRPILIYVGSLSKSLMQDDYFDKLISFDELLSVDD